MDECCGACESYLKTDSLHVFGGGGVCVYVCVWGGGGDGGGGGDEIGV